MMMMIIIVRQKDDYSILRTRNQSELFNKHENDDSKWEYLLLPGEVLNNLSLKHCFASREIELAILPGYRQFVIFV